MSGPWLFALRFAVAGLVQFALLLASPLRPAIERFSESLAAASAGLIRVFGGACEQHAAILTAPGANFGVEVRDGCNGVNVVILLWSAVLAYPAGWSWRAIGLIGGVAAIQILNLGRIISLFYLGQLSREAFDFAHLYLWETLIMLDAMFVFGWWSRRV